MSDYAKDNAFRAWWNDMVRRADKIIAANYSGDADDDVRRLVIHAYVEGQLSEIKDGTAAVRARTSQMEADLRRLRGES